MEKRLERIETQNVEILTILRNGAVKQAKTETKVHFLGITVFGLIGLVVAFIKEKMG